MRMMNWTALGLAAGMSSCSLMASVTSVAPAPVPGATAVAQQAATPAATILSRSAPRPA
jgi:hypothetical protein